MERQPPRRPSRREGAPPLHGAMPRDGALVLSDLRSPTLSIVCEPCGRRGSYNVARLMDQH